MENTINLDATVDRNYDGRAQSYDAERFSGSDGEFNARTDARILLELVARTKAPRVYDIPVGTARAAEYLRPANITIVGCDLSNDMLEIARSKADGLNLNLELIKADASRLPFASDSIECIVSLRFLHLFTHRDRLVFVKEFHRVITPGGYLICSVTNGFYGLGLNLARRASGRMGLSLLWPNQAAELFADWNLLAVRGNFLPLQRLVARIGPKAEQTLHSWVSRGFLRSFCFEKFYLLRKPA